MSLTLRIKSSSRAGRFKKKLVSQECLLLEAPLIEAKMTPLKQLLLAGDISQAEFAALYLLAYLSHRFPGGWLGAKKPSTLLKHSLAFKIHAIPFQLEPNISRRLRGFETIGDVLNNFALKSTPEAVNRALLKWSDGSYGLELLFHIPRPTEVLDQQKRGRRCVTILTEASRIQNYVLGERDALSFMMHDLIHADHFYHDNQSFKGQLGFYSLLDFCVQKDLFSSQLEQAEFVAEFDYLISDMNAYPVHLMKCLKAALTHYSEEKYFFAEWIQKISTNQLILTALLELNTADYQANRQDQHILNLLEEWRLRA